MKRLIFILIAIYICLLPAALCFADSNTDAVADPAMICNIYIDYKEDTEGNEPVVNAEFTAYRISSVNEYGAYEPVECVLPEDLEGENAGLILEKVKAEVSEKADYTEVYHTVTDEHGRGCFAAVESGLYVIEESVPAADHFASEPCLVQVPYTMENRWEYEQTIEPKAEPAGKLRISKTVRSTRGDKDQEFHFQIFLEGISEPVHYLKGDEEGFIVSGESITLKGGESALLEMIPSGCSYKVVETEADTGEFITSYSGAEGHILPLEVTEVKIINTQVPPPTGDIPLEYMAAGVSLISFGLACLLISRLRKDKEHI